jgi:hypothetical protein
MLIGNYVLGWWGDSIQLDGSTTEGWLAGATSFWIMPAIFALAIAVIFFLFFWEKNEEVEEPVAETDGPAPNLEASPA